MHRPTKNSVFETDPPELTESEINALTRKYFGIKGTQTILDSERDQNIKISTDNKIYVLKVSNVAEDESILELQNQVLIHLQENSPCPCAPRVMRGLDNKAVYQHQSKQGNHCIRLLSFIDGELYSQVDSTPVLHESLGEFLGNLSTSLSGFGHPFAHRSDFLWNLDNAMRCKDFLQFVDDQENRTLLANLFKRYEAHVLPQLKSLRAGVIHQDANDNNIVVSRDDGKVMGLIDFGDLT